LIIVISIIKIILIIQNHSSDNNFHVFSLRHTALDAVSPSETVELFQGIPHQVRYDSVVVRY